MSRSFSHKFWEDKRGHFVVWQKPNIWLTTWFLAMVANWLLPSGWLSKSAGFISLIALVVWAVLEFTQGANYFRRLIGLLVLLLLVFNHIFL